MTYHLWLDDLDCGYAADEHALQWRDRMTKRYEPDVRIEPAPGATPDFPVADADDPGKTAKLTRYFYS